MGVALFPGDVTRSCSVCHLLPTEVNTNSLNSLEEQKPSLESFDCFHLLTWRGGA